MSGGPGERWGKGLGDTGSDRWESRAGQRVRSQKGHRMCQTSPESPTQARVLLVTAWGRQSVGLAREGLEGLSGVHLSGENARPLSGGGGGTGAEV